MSFGHYPRRDATDLVDLLARRPELRDVGIAGYLAGAAVEGVPGMPLTMDPVLVAICIAYRGEAA